jgi:hypothetical protein
MPFVAGFETSINLDNVGEKVYGFDNGVAPSLTNTGILRDDGVTNLYADESASGQDKVFYAPNGKAVSLSYADQSVYVDGVKVGNIGAYGLSDRVSSPMGAIDMALTASDTWLLLTKAPGNSFSNAFVTTTAPGSSGWSNVAYGNGVWVAVAKTTSTTAGIARSTDGGATWSFVTTTAPAGSGWNDVAYGNGIWVAAVNSSSTTASVAYSTDNALTWSFATLSDAVGKESISYGNGFFLMPGSGGVLRSSNGSTWTLVTTTSMYRTGYGNGVWIGCVSSGSGTAVYKSTDDGLTWSTINTGLVFSGAAFGAPAFGNGVWIIALNVISTTKGIMRSTDGGDSWGFVTSTAPAAPWLYCSYGQGIWQLFASTSSTTAGIARSTDGGLTWSFITTSAPGGNWRGGAYGAGVFITVAQTNSTTAGVFRTTSTSVVSYKVSEYDPESQTVTGSTTFTTAIAPTTANYACLVKSHQMTLANVDVAYIYFTGSTVTCKVFVAGVEKTIFNAAGHPYKYTGISAFKNGGTYAVGGVPTTAAMPQTYSLPSPYTTPALVGTECSYLANYEEFNTSASLTLNLIGTPSTLSTSNWSTFGTKVSISTTGVVTATTITNSLASLVIIPTNAYSGFGWSSGIFKSTTATKFSPFILDAPASAAIVIIETVTDYGTKPVPVCSIGLTSAQKAFLYGIAPGNTLATTGNARPSQVVWGGTYGAMPIVEQGNVADNSPVCQWVNSAGVYTVSIPGPQTAPGTNTITIATIGANTYQMFPISKDVVQLTDSYGTVVDTVTGNVEVNAGAHCPGIVSDIYLTSTNLVGYQTTTKYSNAIDVGTLTLVTGPTATSSMTATSIAGAVLLPVIFYAGATSPTAVCLYSGGAQVATDKTIGYTTNNNVPPPVDAQYSGGGVKLLGSSALQTVGEADADAYAQYYAGYTLANQLPIAYDFFNLFGQLYGFDGTKIFRIPVNGATVGTPEQVALASGLTFVANSPTVAWFYSTFDNTMYVFTGGQKVEKWQEMTGTSAVQSGAYSVRENSLYLQLADSTVIVFRDNYAGILSNAYASQTTYTTDLGTYFVNDATPSLSTLWSYYAGTGTPIPCTWQSGYYGMGRNQYCRITQVVLTLKVTDVLTSDITVNYRWVTANDSGTESATFYAGTYQASSTGYVRIQYNPTQALVYGASIGVSFDKKAILYDAVMYYTDGGVAPVPNRLP